MLLNRFYGSQPRLFAAIPIFTETLQEACQKRNHFRYVSKKLVLNDAPECLCCVASRLISDIHLALDEVPPPLRTPLGSRIEARCTQVIP